ncbi:30795_t:CDS:2, partial [Gigaspora margarita]
MDYGLEEIQLLENTKDKNIKQAMKRVTGVEKKTEKPIKRNIHKLISERKEENNSNSETRKKNNFEKGRTLRVTPEELETSKLEYRREHNLLLQNVPRTTTELALLRQL